MKKTLKQKTSYVSLLTGGAMIALFVFSFIGIQNAYAMITSQLDLGDSNGEVTELQTYLATNSSIYPSGLVTGYFGQLTKAAVERFQTAQGIISQGTPATTGYGRVGPTTMARINSLLGGLSYNTPQNTSPSFSNVSVNHSKTSATLAWRNGEPTQGQVYWSKSPLTMSEATGPQQQPYVSGNFELDAGGLQNNHSITLSNLDSDTTYYYVIRGVDNAGNMSMVWPSSFRTNS